MGKHKGHIPIRTCISCGVKRSKKEELIRLVLDAEGRVVRDGKMTKPGRGAYVCKNKACWERLVKGTRLNNAFRRRGTIAVHPELRAGFF